MRHFWSGPDPISFRKAIEISIFMVTFLVIVFFSILIHQTAELICNNDGARQFIERIKIVPLEAWKIPTFSLLLFFILVLSSVLRARIRELMIVQLLLSLADLMICIGIIAVLGFGYRGILFIAILNAVRFIPQIRLRYTLVTLFVVTYMLADYDIVSMKFPVFSLNDYMDYYKDSQRFLFYGIRNILISLNETLFILFMVMEIQIWIEENIRTHDLNQRLLKTSEDLQLANVRLEEYARRSEESAKIKERNRLAREIHDIVGHALMGIDIGLKACLEIFTRDPGRVRSQLEKISTLARSGVEDIRRSVHQLKMDQDEGRNFIGSLEALVIGIRECTGAEITLIASGTPYPLAPLVEEALYRAAQESLTNAIRHGEASRIELEIQFQEKWIKLAVRDNGKSCPVISEGFGLQHMRERSEYLSGNVVFTNLPIGFLVTISIPIDPRSSNDA
jgi:signal transduction histidine kinase